MSFEQIELTTDGAVARIVFNRPNERNAMTARMGEEVRDAVQTINDDPAVRAVVITGAGRAFCAGADLATLGAETGSETGEGLGGGERFYRLFLSLRDLAVPSVAAINGHAIGAGICVTLGADVRVMKRGAKAGFTFSRLGIHPGMAATWALPRLVGPANAADLLYSGRLFEADEAHALGLVQRVADEADFDEVVDGLAASYAAAAPVAVRMIKRTLRGAHERTIDDALLREAAEQERTFRTDDAREGIEAIREKREPRFQGR